MRSPARARTSRTRGGRSPPGCGREAIDPERVIVTTLDCDNIPHESYFDCVAYEYAIAPDRARVSFQPISLYITNIWDAPAPSRVVASANCFWNLTTTVRLFAARNFASHSQPAPALIDMGFWSTRTIVEDGHQYWRGWFHFDGDYRVVPVHVPIYQDAVLAGGFAQTMVAQFKRLSRWSYGASDVPYVGVRVFAGDARSPFWPGFLRFLSLLEGHVSLATISVIIAVGGWIPFVVATQTGQATEFIERMPMTVGLVQQLGMIGLIVSVVVFRALLAPAPGPRAAARSVTMWLQWRSTRSPFSSSTPAPRSIHSGACSPAGTGSASTSPRRSPELSRAGPRSPGVGDSSPRRGPGPDADIPKPSPDAGPRRHPPGASQIMGFLSRVSGLHPCGVA